MANTASLLQGENVVMSSDNNELVLTNYRVKYEAISRSGSLYKSIPIRKISACVINTTRYPVLLALAGLAGIAMFLVHQTEQRLVAGIAAFIFIALFFITRYGQIEIFSDSGERIAVPTKGLGHEQVRKFVESIANQCNEYVR